jgi:hypothetical protein
MQALPAELPAEPAENPSRTQMTKTSRVPARLHSDVYGTVLHSVPLPVPFRKGAKNITNKILATDVGGCPSWYTGWAPSKF